MSNGTHLTISRRLVVFAVSLGLITDALFPKTSRALEQPLSQPVKLETVVAVELPKAGPRKPRRVATVVATAYSSTPDQTDDTPFTTANGKQVYDGLIAANWLPFGTRVKLPELFGDKIFTIDDRMNERYGYGRIDLWFDAPRAVLMEFGVKRVKMEIY